MCFNLFHDLNFWLSTNEPYLNPNETQYLTFHNRQKSDSIDDRIRFGPYVETVAIKADKKMASLIRIMPNINGPSSGKRRVLCSAVNNILLYGAPIWAKALQTLKYRRLMERAQRTMLLRVASAYRTVSGVALAVVTGVVPIDLMVQERVYMYKNSHVGSTIRAESRQMSVN